MMVDSVMHQPAITMDAKATVREAAEQMRDRHIGSVVVLEKGVAAAILTESDVVRIVADARDPAKVRIGEVASRPLIMAEPTLQIEDAGDLMREHRIKRLVVVVGDQVRGVVTARDLAYAMPENARRFLDAIKARWED